MKHGINNQTNADTDTGTNQNSADVDAESVAGSCHTGKARNFVFDPSKPGDMVVRMVVAFANYHHELEEQLERKKRADDKKLLGLLRARLFEA